MNSKNAITQHATQAIADAVAHENSVGAIRRAWNAVRNALTMQRDGEVEVATVEEATREL